MEGERKIQGQGPGLRFRPARKSSRLVPSPVLTALMAVALGSASNVLAAQSPTGTLRGTTTTANPQGQPLPVAGVSLKLRGKPPNHASFSTTSDNAGSYEFVDLPGGPYTLEASLKGFKTVVKTLTISRDQAVVENIQLELEELRQQIEVRESAPAVSEQSAAPPATLSAPQLIALPLAQQKFKLALPLVPGVIRTPDGKINIKGAVENQGMLLVDSAEDVDPVTGRFFNRDLSIDAIQSLEVYKTPYAAEYGGFSGGLTSIRTKPPSSRWRYGLNDFIPGVRGKSGHIVGISDDEPRFNFSGPITDKLGFSESFIYDVRKQPVRGLAWPRNEIKTQGYNSLTSFQYFTSPKHMVTASVNLFPFRRQFANINSLVPQSASSDDGQRGFSLAATDRVQLGSGVIVSTLFKYTKLSTYAHGQGPADMLITPNGWGGNFFNAWTRASNQEELLQSFDLPRKSWRGHHDLKLGGNLIHSSYDGTSRSHPVLLRRPDDSLAERIDFLGPGPDRTRPASLVAKNTQVALFVQDHWALNHQLALDLGLRYFGQTLGDGAEFEPRAGVIYSPHGEGKTLFRGGIGIFHDRVPLLAGDFTHNPTRVATFFDQQGAPSGSPLTFHNVCGKLGDKGARMVSSCSELGGPPYNVTWNLEVDRRLPRHVVLRVGYLSSQTYQQFTVSPVNLAPSNSMLLLTNSGRSRYHEFETTLRFHPGESSDVSISYVHSRTRGNVNTLSEVFAPFEQPVIRPDIYASLPSDVPNRLIAWGTFTAPWKKKFTFSPVLDWHTGFPYSNVDILQNYVGRPNSQRFPNFFSLDFRVSRVFHLPLISPFTKHQFRMGFYVSNLTNHDNPRDVFNNVSSPFFGNFVGFQHRVEAVVFDIVD